MENSKRKLFQQASWLMQIGGLLFLAVRGLLRSPVTYLILVIIWYRDRQLNAPFSAKPLDIEGLILWYWQLDSTMQAAIVTSLITVAGFMLSFYMGTRLWRQQKIADMRLEMSEEIQRFFSDAAASVRTIDGMAEMLIDLHKLSKMPRLDSDDLGRVEVLATLISQRASAFEQARSQLMNANIVVHDIRSKHSIPITSSLIGYLGYVKATKSLTSISECVYFTQQTPPESPNYAQKLLAGLNYRMVNEFRIRADKLITGMLGGASLAKGGAVGSVMRPNFWSVVITALSLRQLANEED